MPGESEGSQDTGQLSSLDAAKQDRKAVLVGDHPKYAREPMETKDWAKPTWKYSVDATALYKEIGKLVQELGQGKGTDLGETPPPNLEEQAQQLMGTLAEADAQAKDMTAPVVPEGTPPRKWHDIRRSLLSEMLAKYQEQQLGQSQQPGPGEVPPAAPVSGPESGGGESSSGPAGGAPATGV